MTFLCRFCILSVVVVLWNLEMPTAQGAHAWAPFLQPKTRLEKCSYAEDVLYEQQMNKLQNEKQLTITNSAYAEEVLEKLSYYSLIGGYKNIFKHPASGNYIYGVTFEEIVSFYYFDEELRTLFLKYILHVIISLRKMYMK